MKNLADLADMCPTMHKTVSTGTSSKNSIIISFATLLCNDRGSIKYSQSKTQGRAPDLFQEGGCNYVLYTV